MSYMSELLMERDALHEQSHAHRLIDEEITRLQDSVHASPLLVSGGPLAPPPHVKLEAQPLHGEPAEAFDAPRSRHPPPRPVHAEPVVLSPEDLEPVKLSEKVFAPVKENPKFNFVGKLLGPRGNTLKRLQAETGTRMSVLGRGSMKDREAEEQLRASEDAKHSHLNEDLHVLIHTEGPRVEAQGRMNAALATVKRYMSTDNNDTIRESQMREMAVLNGDEAPEQPTFVTLPPQARPQIVHPGMLPAGLPPGAIIIQGVPPGMQMMSGRPVQMGHHQLVAAAPSRGPPTAVKYEQYEATYDAAYEGYPETGKVPVYYEHASKPVQYPNVGSRRPRPRESMSPPPAYPSVKRSRMSEHSGESRRDMRGEDSSHDDPYRRASMH